jgi:probable F420-dependent oxidoreductase
MKVRFAVGPHAGSLSGKDLLAFAHAVEDQGFDGIWLSDLPIAPVLDPLLALAMVAGRTERLRLGANVVPLGCSPFLLAKQLAQLDQLASGRLLLSFVPGLGGAAEAQALGLDSITKNDALEEALGLIRRWWAGETVDYRSEHLAFSDLPAAALPIQDPLEVWLGGRGPKALDRAGRIADGWLGAQLTPEESGTARERIQAAAARAGREFDPEHFGMSIGYAHDVPDPGLLTQTRGRRTDIDQLELVPVGPDGLRAFIAGYIEAGLSKFVVRPLGPVRSWGEEARWLSDAILDLQT